MYILGTEGKLNAPMSVGGVTSGGIEGNEGIEGIIGLIG